MALNTFKNFIHGEWIARGSRGTFEDRNPADHVDLVGNAPLSDRTEVDAAVAAAKAALNSWSRTPVPITPWNFPIAIPAWKILAALVCGNTLVLKPSPDAPGSACRLIEALEEAGIPRGVVNLVHGDAEVGQALAEHPDVPLVSFTGSSAVGKHLAAVTGPKLKRLCLELGGKNGQIVMDDADLDLAVEGALWGAFGTTGQRCTATSRLIVHRKVLDAFTGKFLERTRKLKSGQGRNAGVDLGPLVSEKQRARVHEWVGVGQNEDRAELLTGGAFETEGDCAKGWFYQPTVFGNCISAMRICQEEIFGPVTCIIPVSSYDEAIRVINDTRYGLSSSIYTRDVSQAMRALHEIESGITYVNGPTIGAEVHLPFGGVKETGNGHREAGTAALDLYSEWKSVYCDFSGRLQKAQIDTAE